jgi:ABC-type multidrug transport system permease subunit
MGNNFFENKNNINLQKKIFFEFRHILNWESIILSIVHKIFALTLVYTTKEEK